MRLTSALIALALAAIHVTAGWCQNPDAGPAASTGGSPAVGSPHNPADDLPVFVRSQRFGLPILLSQAAYQITSVQMYVSSDRGVTWRLYAEQPPTAREFLFQTSQDGEFWFASKTVDDRQVARPVGEPRAERRVVVDTQPPKLEFNADVGNAGEVRLAWRIVDAHLDPRSVKLEYQDGAAGNWSPIVAEGFPQVALEGGVAGQHLWSPRTTSKAVQVRLDVADRAGNRAVASRRLFLPRLAAVPLATPGTAGSSASRPTEVPTAANSPPATAVAGIPWPADNQLIASTTPDSRPHEAVAQEPGAAAAVSPAPDVPPAAVEGVGRLASQSAVSEATTESPGLPSSSGNQVPADPGSSASEAEAGVDESTRAERPKSQEPGAGWPPIPPGETFRATRARRFDLEYDVESLGPNDILEVQLWATQDGGRSWEKWGVDKDRSSPFDVEVDREGLYGFRIVILAANGLAGNVPRSGAPADIWVGVDSVPPVAEITGVIYGAGPRLGQLEIRWNCQDQRLAERPIALAFSAERTGPWTTIASALSNSGQYYWQVDPSVPAQVFIRLECRDEAGSTTEFVTREAINIEGLVPRGRIRDVRPREPSKP